MIRIGLAGLGKMGLSHLAILKSHPDVDLVAVCDTSRYVLNVIEKYTGIKGYSDYQKLLNLEKPDAVFIATPSQFHGDMVAAALDQNVNVFCEKPFCLDLDEGLRLTELAEGKELVNQVGYHYRFVGAFEKMKRVVDAGIVGKIHHIRAEAYGPVILRAKGGSWRASRNQGGGCLYDYACHGIDLITYLLGRPDSVRGTVLNKIFSEAVEDEAYSTLIYPNGIAAQIAANWSDESQRKMSTKVSIWGTNGKIVADRQEIHIYVRHGTFDTEGLNVGWNTRYTTDLIQNVWFYLRGEEYSAQVDHFVQAIINRSRQTRSSFRSALDTDIVAKMMIDDAEVARMNSVSPLNNGMKNTEASSNKNGTWRKLTSFFQ